MKLFVYDLKEYAVSGPDNEDNYNWDARYPKPETCTTTADRLEYPDEKPCWGWNPLLQQDTGCGEPTSCGTHCRKCRNAAGLKVLSDTEYSQKNFEGRCNANNFIGAQFTTATARQGRRSPAQARA